MRRVARKCRQKQWQRRLAETGFAGFLRKYFWGRGPLSGGWIGGEVNAFQNEISRVTHQKSFLFGVGD
jgi:hypothetical protein